MMVAKLIERVYDTRNTVDGIETVCSERVAIGCRWVKANARNGMTASEAKGKSGWCVASA